MKGGRSAGLALPPPTSAPAVPLPFVAALALLPPAGPLKVNVICVNDSKRFSIVIPEDKVER